MVCDVMTAIVEGEIGSLKKRVRAGPYYWTGLLDQNTGLGSTFNALKIFLISTCEVA